jgi:hypothetical protein
VCESLSCMGKHRASGGGHLDRIEPIFVYLFLFVI